MDLLLLLGQVALVVLLVVMPLFASYDKWREWSSQRRAVAVALAIGIAAVAFGQYRRLVMLDKGGLQHALGNAGLFKGPWYARSVSVALWEYVAAMISGGVLLGLAFEAGFRRNFKRALGFTAVFGLLVLLASLLKMHGWGE
ncbi:MAG: hypothetical protein IPJ65_03310 [Archangiaceae bacterium]|nr:hypothetical protein [Archangiaceae bacterium]